MAFLEIFHEEIDMTTHNTESCKLVELKITTFRSREDESTNFIASEFKDGRPNNQLLIQYQIVDASEDLDD
jgi:hypothetical protein